VFLRGYSSITTDKKRRDENFAFVIQRLEKFASSEIRFKSDVIDKLKDALQDENRARDAAGRTDLIEERSDRTYQRWIDQHLDPFVVSVQRAGRAKALKTYGTIENGLTASFPGELVQIDAWMFHIETLATTRERWNQMTPKSAKTRQKGTTLGYCDHRYCHALHSRVLHKQTSERKCIVGSA